MFWKKNAPHVRNLNCTFMFSWKTKKQLQFHSEGKSGFNKVDTDGGQDWSDWKCMAWLSRLTTRVWVDGTRTAWEGNQWTGLPHKRLAIRTTRMRNGRQIDQGGGGDGEGGQDRGQQGEQRGQRGWETEWAGRRWIEDKTIFSRPPLPLNSEFCSFW